MTRILMLAGLALTVVLTIGGIGAAAASAEVDHSFVFEGEKTVLTGVGANPKFVMQEKFAFVCGKTESAGTAQGKAVDQVVVRPRYSGDCTILGLGVAVSITTAGCNYVFDSDTTIPEHPFIEGSEAEDATLGIACEGGHEIKIEATGCSVQIGPEQTLHGLAYANVEGAEPATHDLVVAVTVNTIKYKTAGMLCGFLGIKVGEFEDGTYESLITVEGYVDTGEVEGTVTGGTTYGHVARTAVGLAGTI